MLDRFNNFAAAVSRVSASVCDAALTIIYPATCRVCGGVIESWRDGAACAKCWQEIEQKRAAADLCARCGGPLPPLPADIKFDGRQCGQCDDFAFRFARACGPYEGALRESVLNLKHRPHIPRRLSEMLRRTFAALPDNDRIEAIIPVPLHPERLAERGFNQSEIIARALASTTGLRVDTAAIIRVKKTEKHGAGMGAPERARSLAKAFTVRAPRLIEDRQLLIVDDVMTTASTAQELAGTLIEGGARSVSVITLTRTVNRRVDLD